MLEKIKEQENIILLFFIGIILLVGSYSLLYFNVIDLLYIGVIIYYFCCFLKIKKCRK